MAEQRQQPERHEDDRELGQLDVAGPVEAERAVADLLRLVDVLAEKPPRPCASSLRRKGVAIPVPKVFIFASLTGSPGIGRYSPPRTKSSCLQAQRQVGLARAASCVNVHLPTRASGWRCD